MTILSPLFLGMISANFGYNWHSGSGEEVKNVKDGQTDGRRTTSDRKSSLELSAQVS
jgi:hypothetical protein